MAYFSFPKEKSEIEYPEILNIEGLEYLIKAFRYKCNADRHSGYNLCREINKSLVETIRDKYPEMETYILLCRNYPNVARLKSHQGATEHFVGVVRLLDGLYFFDGTADQLINGTSSIILEKINSENFLGEISEKIGGGWEIVKY